jgi:G3E family GTPase
MSALAEATTAQLEESDDEYEEVPDSEKTPVTIVTGFLGSGKTTLVNYILKEQHGWKICVVENEFGEVQIDGDLVNENIASREDIITMDNGCVCCSVRGDLVRTFGMLVARRKEFDAIIIETTGLADPSPICFTFSSNALIMDNFRIDSVVCLVDAKHIDIHLDDVKPDGSINEAEHQIAFADRIVLNKVDLVSKQELSDVEDRIKSMNSFATLIKTERSKAPLDQILGIGSFSLDKCCEINPEGMEEFRDDPEEVDNGHVHDEHCNHDHDHDHAHDHNHGSGACTLDHDHSAHEHEPAGDCTLDHDHSSHDHKHSHDHDNSTNESAKKKVKKVHNLSLVSSVGFTIKGQLDTIKFNEFMSNLLAAKAADLYRTKGVLAFHGQGDTKFVFQGVHEQINFGPADKPWGKDEERTSKMVFIGKNLDYDFFKKSLEDSVADGQPDVEVTMHKRK